jgi:hypothetical protein
MAQLISITVNMTFWPICSLYLLTFLGWYLQIIQETKLLRMKLSTRSRNFETPGYSYVVLFTFPFNCSNSVHTSYQFPALLFWDNTCISTTKDVITLRRHARSSFVEKRSCLVGSKFVYQRIHCTTKTFLLRAYFCTGFLRSGGS